MKADSNEKIIVPGSSEMVYQRKTIKNTSEDPEEDYQLNLKLGTTK